ncbi:unnamed protein product [Rhodiola kirilowii]
MNRLKQVHAYTIRNGIDHSKSLIVDLLEIPNLKYARKVFDHIPKPTSYLYNKLIQAYCYHGPQHQCLSLYADMFSNGCFPNEHSFTFIFAACAATSSPCQGMMVHTQFVKSGFEFDVFAVTALVDMYAKLGMLSFARRKFDEMGVKDTPTWNAIIAGYTRAGDMDSGMELFRLMPLRNVVSWTAMISGYAQNGRYADALDMFMDMEKEKGVKPNEVTIASVLPACASIGALEQGERIEAYARENGYFKNVYVVNAVLEMYARCGRICTAKMVFEEMGHRRNLCSWNSMIMGLAVHGKSCEALEFFHRMLGEGTKPDDITFVGVLLACTHGGMVEKGRELFNEMEDKFSIIPKLEHYGCMVDLLGRAGKLTEAHNLIRGMKIKPDSVIWGALLGACSFHNHVELAEIAVEFLFKLEPRNPGNYVIISNIYASAGRWDGVTRLRKLMKGCQITKAAGYSFIEVGAQIHKFIVEDKSHPRCKEIYGILDELSSKMKFRRSVNDSDIEEMF